VARLSDVIDQKLLEDCEVIVCDNVAHYFYASKEVFGEPSLKWSINDFPNIAPPFKRMLLEWKLPRFVAPKPVYVGVLIESSEHNLSSSFDFKWYSLLSLYVAMPDKDWSDRSVGALIEVKEDGTWNGKLLPLDFNGSEIRDDHNASVAIDYFRRYMWPALLAISFMHCKNVELKTQIPPAPLSKKHQKKTGRPLVKYKVLEIEPMKKVLRTEGQSETLGLKHALHICRGHFKDYSKGGGLFGKYKGLYWWESHVRGDPSQGVVVKDYSVNPPTDTPT